MLEIIGIVFLTSTGVFLCGYSLLLFYILIVFAHFKRDWTSYLFVAVMFGIGGKFLHIVSTSVSISVSMVKG